MDIKGNYKLFKDFLELVGWDKFMEYLQEKFPSLKLYCVSKSWKESSEYILKAKGTCGDLLINWEDIK